MTFRVRIRTGRRYTMTAHTNYTAPLPLLTLSLLALSALLPAGASAQVLQGRVVDDSTGIGIPEATVTLLRGTVRLQGVITDSIGAFRFALPDSGAYRLEAGRIGYTTTQSHPVRVGAGDTISVEFRIRVRAVLLRPLVITARRNLGRSRFYERMEEWGRGVFITPSMIDSIQPRHPADVFLRRDDTWLTWVHGRTHDAPRVRTFLGHGCVGYMLNLLPIRGASWGEDSPLRYLLGSDVVAVEYYRYIGEVPPELRSRADVDDQMCGLVVFWTHEGW